MTIHDPILPAIAAIWRAFDAYGEALERDEEGNGQTPEVIAAADRYRDAWNWILATRPLTIEGAASLARCALDLAERMGSDDYLEEALEALAVGLPPRPDG